MVTAAIARLRRLIDRLAEDYRVDGRVLAVLRIAYGLWILLLPVDYVWPATVPTAFYQPRLGPAALFDAPPPLPVLTALQIALAVLACVLVVGYRTTAVSVSITLLSVLGGSFVYAYGKVDHFILFELAPLALAAAGWGGTWSVDARRGRDRPADGFPVLLWAVTVGFALFTAAVPKVMAGWLDPAREGTRGYVARLVADPLTIGPFGPAVFSVDVPALWKALDYATVVVEAGLIFTVVAPLLLRCWVPALIGFHLGVYLVMGISFAPYVFVYAPLLLGGADRLWRASSRRDPRVPDAVPRTA